MFNKRIKIKELLTWEPHNQEVIVMGWVRTFRNNQFIALNDGSTNINVQVVIELGKYEDDFLKRVTTSAALKVTGIVIPSLGKGQKLELKATEVEILGDSDAEKYPLQPKKHSLEFLREIAHLRFRTNTFGSVFRIRHSLAFAVHKFFNEKGFFYLHTPIITASDAEGAGEMFRVTTLDLTNPPVDSEFFNKQCDQYFLTIVNTLKNNQKEHLIDEVNLLIKSSSYNEKKFDFDFLIKAKSYELYYFEELFDNIELKKLVNEIYAVVEDVFFEKKDGKLYFKDDFIKSIRPHRSGIREEFRQIDEDILKLTFYNFKFVFNQLRIAKDRKVNFKEDFFGRSTNLTVSGQLEGELAATALGDIYTFGPTFRAENSNTPRHLAEFWMIEPEMAFYDLEDNMNLAEEFIKYIIRHAMDNNRDDLEFLGQRLADEEKQLPQDKRSEMGLIEKLEFVLNNSFERITYTEAIDILLQSPAYKKKKFQFDVKWGIDMQSEHERYLVEKHFKKPVIVSNYPKEIKAFYMRQNDDGKTVAAMDILAPGIGEIVGGSQREERLEKLEQRMKEMNVPANELWWYLDTRRYGTVPHAGFGLGFERMVQFVTGMLNIRDVIAFPRTPKNAEF